jgi:hypothetical protein
MVFSRLYVAMGHERSVYVPQQEAYGAVTPGYARLRQRFDLGALWTIGIKGTF